MEERQWRARWAVAVAGWGKAVAGSSRGGRGRWLARRERRGPARRGGAEDDGEVEAQAEAEDLGSPVGDRFNLSAHSFPVHDPNKKMGLVFRSPLLEIVLQLPPAMGS